MVRNISCSNSLKEIRPQDQIGFSSFEKDRKIANYAKEGSTVWRLEFEEKCEWEREHSCVEASSKKGKKPRLSPGKVATSFLSLPLLQENIFKHAPDRRGLKSQAELKWNCCWKFLSTFCHPFSLWYSKRKCVIRVTSLCVNVHT